MARKREEEAGKDGEKEEAGGHLCTQVYPSMRTHVEPRDSFSLPQHFCTSFFEIESFSEPAAHHFE